MTDEVSKGFGDGDDQSQEGATEAKTLGRREFLSTGIAAAGSLLIGASGEGVWQLAVNAADLPPVDAAKLKERLKGQVLTAGDADFKKFVFGELWNELRPDRSPQLLVRVAEENDVVEAVKFARANKIKVAVRGGGHNWCCPSLRNGGMLIDLSNLNQVISIDPENRRAVVQPIISNREIQQKLKPHNLSFPSGHCPQVKMSGYLLSGGMAWNQGVWGPGVGSVEAYEMVTADGELIVANKDQHQDYYWAARGAGPGLFAVVTRYHLKLYPLPKAITASVYYFPVAELSKVAEWVGSVSKKLTSNVEFSLFFLNAPPELAEKCKDSAGKVALVTATVFADTEEEAKAALKPLDECPVMDKCLSKSIAQPTDFESLFDSSGALWPANLRNQVDALFSNAKLETIFNSTREHFLKAPSSKSILMFAVFTGKDIPAKLPDCAFSMSAHLYGGPWTMWEKAEDDAANIAWHARLVGLLKPYVSGHYVSETDTVGHKDYAQKSYIPANWKRLAELRKKYDPTGVFFDFSNGLS